MPSKWLKQIIQIKHNRVKNPNWPEANQLVIYKHGRGFEQLVVRAGLELGASELQVQRSNHSATLPPITQPWTIVRSNLVQKLKAIKMIRIRKIAMKFKCTRIHFGTQVFTTGCCMSLRNFVGLPLNMFQTTQPWTELKDFFYRLRPI